MRDDHDVMEARDLGAGDWTAVAALLGQEASHGARLARHVEATYRPWFGWVVPAPGGAAAARGGNPPIDGAIIAGVRRRTAAGAPASVNVAWVGVAPSRRRSGLGRRLVGRAVAGAARLGALRVEATADAADAGATSFFQACGFEVERRTAEVRIDGEGALELREAVAPASAIVRPLRHDEIPALTGLLIHLAVERATDPHDDLDGLTPSILAGASMHADHVGVAAWEAADADAPLGVAWGSRHADGVRLRFVGVHEDVRRRGIGRALLAGLLQASRRETLVARVHEPAGIHGFLVGVGAVMTSETVDLARPVGDAADGN